MNLGALFTLPITQMIRLVSLTTKKEMSSLKESKHWPPKTPLRKKDTAGWYEEGTPYPNDNEKKSNEIKKIQKWDEKQLWNFWVKLSFV